MPTRPGRLRRLLPSPLLSGLLVVSWLMLNESASVGHLLLAVLLAVAIPWWTNRFRADHTAVLRKPELALRFALRVLVDIVVSNIDVARRVLGPEAVLQSRWLWVPLDVRSPAGHRAVLAGMVTLTPGTLSSEFSPDRRFLLVHALHCTDEAEAVAEIKARYEAPLLEILG
jgi:multicomponent K+:H+ antiporter subunit E